MLSHVAPACAHSLQCSATNAVDGLNEHGGSGDQWHIGDFVDFANPVSRIFNHVITRVSSFLDMKPPADLAVCDPKGRAEMGGHWSTSMGQYCTDPLHRGYNVCVTSLPADFAERSGSFCYSNILNNAARSGWFHETILLDTDNMYEGLDINEKWWHIVVTKQNADGTYEVVVRNDDGMNIASWHNYDPFRMRAYQGPEISINDEVQFRGGKGKITRVFSNGIFQVVDHRIGLPRYFHRSALQFAGPHSLRSTSATRLKPGDDVDILNPANRKTYPAVITQLSPSIKADIYDSQKSQWFYGVTIPSVSNIRQIPPTSGDSIMNVCKLHVGQPWCITSRALHQYLNYKEPLTHAPATPQASGLEHRTNSDIEIKCDASGDWRSRKLGGTGCWWQDRYVGDKYARAGKEADFIGEGKMTPTKL
eukprot:GEMP01032127.1.p1 GENE.GEMP01032127.1~~GEMP01032127.1.p1  ORF type:complete len:421 (-),score=72.59 GEMP01032127.1:788-2050(-)